MGRPRATNDRSRLAPMARRRKQLKAPEPLSGVLSRSGPNRPARGASPIAPQAWHKAVGPRIAERTRPLGLDGHVLTVQTATAAWMQELTFLAPTIIQRLAACGIAVKRIRFRVGPIEPPLRELKPAPIRVVPAPRPLPQSLSRAIAKIGDPVLRRIIARAAATNLAWQNAPGALVSEGRPGARAPRSASPGTAPPGRGQQTSRGAGPRRP
jgi:hypothetical protein